MKVFCLLILALLTFIQLIAQEGIGLNPPGMKWRKIETPAGKIIFPKGTDSLAYRAATLMNYQRANDSTIAGGDATQRVPHIIQNQSTLPAGFSTPAPWRNEYYVTPPANIFLGPVSWTDALELHEYRHAQQFSMANQGLTWPYKIVMGQTGWLLNSLITQPLWFREGDAVLAETIFTHGGRGRLPSFHMEYRALRLAGYHYDYEKAHYTSLRDFVPNPYRIGYYMVTTARRNYGNDIWYKVLLDTYQKKGFIYPFSRSLKKFTGKTTKEFYHKTTVYLDSLWVNEDRKLLLTNAIHISNPKQKKYTNYRYPQFIGENKLVVLKSSFDLIPTYYLLSANGEEEKLFSPGRYTDDHATLVAENGKMVWAESGFHERYINKDYSIIKTHDINSGKTRKLSSKTRYFSPALSKDGTKVIATETDFANKYYHVILDANTGKLISRRANPGNVFLSHPRWMHDNIHVVCISISEKGNAIVKLNTQRGSMEILVPYTDMPLSRPFATNEHIYFSAGRDGINNIYALDLSRQIIYQVTSVRFGAFEPVVSPDEKKLVYTEYTADGYRVMEMELDPATWRQVVLESVNDQHYFLKDIPTAEEKNITDTSASPEHYRVQKFTALTEGLFNFYGWLVLPNIPEYGVELYTQNIMSTLRGTAGVLYNTNENRFHYYARVTYAAFYPVIELEYNYGNRHTSMMATEDRGVEPFDQPWREEVISGGVKFPFRLTQGTHNTTLSVEGRYERYHVDLLDTANTEMVLSGTDFNAVRSKFVFSRLKMTAVQHFNPQWGQLLDVEFREGSDGDAQRFQSDLTLYFPGLFRTHSLNFLGSYKKEKTVNAYRFTDDFVMPRGYKAFPFEHILLVSANYQLPVLYPDLSLGSVAFIQRLRWNVFYDYAIGNLNDGKMTMQTPGTELYADFRLFRLFQMSICFRYNFTHESTDDPSPEVVPFQFLVTRFELLN
jgi:hypothetical protein